MSTDEPRPDSKEQPDREAGAFTGEPETAVSTQPPFIQRLPIGRLVLGLVLVALGVVWLLEALDVVSFSFLAVLPAALILVGVVLIAAARTGRHSGLVVLGIVLTVILTIASGFDIKFRGGAGDRSERPASLSDVQREYHLSLGQLTIDLRDVDFGAGVTMVKASVGIGQLTVRVPGGGMMAVEAKGHAGAGDVRLFDRESSGVDVQLFARSVGQGVPPTGQGMLILELSVGLGQIEVTQ